MIQIPISVYNLTVARMEELEQIITNYEREYRELASFISEAEIDEAADLDDGMEEKKRICKKCGAEKPIDEFYPMNGYFLRTCADCYKEIQQQRNRENQTNNKLGAVAKSRKKKKAENELIEPMNDFIGETLEEVQVKAEENGISYGKMVALKYMGKV